MKKNSYLTKVITMLIAATMTFASFSMMAFAQNPTTQPASPSITNFYVPPQNKPASGEGQRKRSLTSDNMVTLSWRAPSGVSVTNYAVVMDGEPITAKLSASTLSHSWRAAEGTHSYSVRAYSSDYDAGYKDSAAQSKTLIGFINKVHKNWDWTATVDKSTKLYKKKSGKAAIKSLPKGTKGIILETYPRRPKKWSKPKRVRIKLPDGKVGWVPYRAIGASANIDVKKDYPASVKRDFVKGYSSNTNYLIWVNGYTQRINIFKGKKGNWTLVSSNRVTLGNFFQPVSRGEKRLGSKKGRVYMIDDRGRSYYFNYSRTFGGSGYFHTRSFWANGRAKNNVTTRPNTKGCIRQYKDDAKFLYSLPKGTKILFK